MSTCSDMDGSNITGTDLSSVGPTERKQNLKKMLKPPISEAAYAKYLADNGIYSEKYHSEKR